MAVDVVGVLVAFHLNVYELIVDPQVYKRTDTGETRCGFVAQQVQAVLPATMQNIVGTTDAEKGLLGIDYARLASVVLWGVAKQQQQQIADLTARIAALETKRTKKA